MQCGGTHVDWEGVGVFGSGERACVRPHCTSMAAPGSEICAQIGIV